MRSLSKKYFRKLCGGAVMFQVLLGLGLMVMMSPMIFTQIKKYNEEIQREEAVNHLETWQKAAASFVVFEKDNVGKIPEGIKTWSGTALREILSDYLGSSVVPLSNGFGQEYMLITNRKGEQIESVVVAYGGGLDRLTLNGIAQFLFDKGAVIDSDGTILSELKLTTPLVNKLKTLVNPTSGGALFMYVSDAFFTSDYLHIAPMPGSSDRASLVNTMIVDLNMNGNSMHNVKNFYATRLEGSNSYVDSLSISDLIFKSPSVVEENFEYQNSDGITGDTSLPVETIDGTLPNESHKIEVNELTVDNAKFKKVFIDEGELETKDVSAKNYYIHGDVNVNSGWPDKTLLNNVVANTFISENGTKSDVIDNIIMDKQIVNADNTIEDSYIYIGQYSTDGSGNKIYNEGSSIVLNLSGVSEVKDICYGSASSQQCLSDRIVKYYDDLQSMLEEYFEAAQQEKKEHTVETSLDGLIGD